MNVILEEKAPSKSVAALFKNKKEKKARRSGR